MSPIEAKGRNTEVKKSLYCIENCLGAKQNNEKKKYQYFMI
jgi:hypothetical protein